MSDDWISSDCERNLSPSVPISLDFVILMISFQKLKQITHLKIQLSEWWLNFKWLWRNFAPSAPICLSLLWLNDEFKKSCEEIAQIFNDEDDELVSGDCRRILLHQHQVTFLSCCEMIRFKGLMSGKKIVFLDLYKFFHRFFPLSWIIKKQSNNKTWKKKFIYYSTFFWIFNSEYSI